MKKPARIALKVVAVVLLLAIVAIAGLWWRLRPDGKGRLVPFFERIDMAAYQPFASGVKASVKLRLFEGLPHQGWEKDLLKSELASKQTFKSHGHYFYETEITPSEADAAALTKLATSAPTFVEWRGSKLCGAFHPDWLLRWTTADGQTHGLHFCFNCHEAKLFGGAYRLYCDVPETPYETLKAALSKYASQRPARPSKTQE